MKLGGYNDRQLRLVYRVAAWNNSRGLWGRLAAPLHERAMPGEVGKRSREDAHVFLRKVLDEALEGMPEDMLLDPLSVFDKGNHLPLSTRFVVALERNSSRTSAWQGRSSAQKQARFLPRSFSIFASTVARPYE